MESKVPFDVGTKAWSVVDPLSRLTDRIVVLEMSGDVSVGYAFALALKPSFMPMVKDSSIRIDE
jgi:hypothetical protein